MAAAKTAPAAATLKIKVFGTGCFDGLKRNGDSSQGEK
jgi:hypothetical protein